MGRKKNRKGNGNKPSSQASNTRSDAMPSVDNAAFEGDFQATGTGAGASSSAERSAVNEATSPPNEGLPPTTDHTIDLDLYGNSDDEDGGVAVTSQSPVGVSTENSEGVERAEEVGEASGTKMAEAQHPVIASTESPENIERAEAAGETSGEGMAEATDAAPTPMENIETQAGQDRTSSPQFDLALRPAPPQSGDDSTDSEAASAESTEASNAGATQGTENAEASRATPDLAESNEGWEVPADTNDDGWDRTEMPTTTEEAPASDETDCKKQLREARERIDELEEELAECKRREAIQGVSIADLPYDQQYPATLELSKALHDLSAAQQDVRDMTKQNDSISRRLENQTSDNGRLVQKLEDCRSHGQELEKQLKTDRKLLKKHNKELREAGEDTSLVDEMVERGDEILELKRELVELKMELAERQQDEAAED